MSMRSRRQTKLVHAGEYAAIVEVEVVESETGWSPYLPVADAQKLEDVRETLRKGDLQGAVRPAKVYRHEQRGDAAGGPCAKMNGDSRPHFQLFQDRRSG